VRKRGGEPEGIEPDRIRHFARGIGARVEFSWSMIDDALAALEVYELDVVLGGLTPRSPWKGRVGLSLPYHVERVVVGVPAGAPALETLDGAEIGCEPGTLSALWLRESRALPVPLDRALESRLPVAAGDWKIRRLGLRATDHVLGENERVIAVAPGENALLTAIDRSLLSARGEVEAALAREPLA
jgi:polar amino acid transport system substrate-binding protein